MKEKDVELLRRAFAAALRAHSHGNLPVGAVLVNAAGEVILEGEHTVHSDGDCTAHAGINLLGAASKKYPPDFLKECTVYFSLEPCPMCAGAVFWSGVQRLVFGLSRQRLYESAPGERFTAKLDMSARQVLENGSRRVLVTGPLLEKEAVVILNAGKKD